MSATSDPTPDRPAPLVTGTGRRSANSTPDRKVLILAACVLFGAILLGAIYVAASAEDPPVTTNSEATLAGEGRPRSIPQPGQGTSPQRGGDRGGWEQLALMGLILGALLVIGVLALRGGSKAKANRAAWLAAAEGPPADGDRPSPSSGSP